MPDRPRFPRNAWLLGTIAAAFAAAYVAETIFRSPTPLGAARLAWNAIVLLSVVWGLVALSGRPALSSVLAIAAYALLVTVDGWKIRYLASPLHPADVYSVSNVFFLHLFSRGTLVLAAILAVAAAGTVVWRFRRTRARVGAVGRVLAGCFAVATLFLLGNVTRFPALVEVLRAQGVSFRHVNPVFASRENGLLLDLLVHVSDLEVTPPEAYSATSIERVLQSAASVTAPSASPAVGPTNVILFVVEAMMDPHDLGFEFTSEPMPFLTELRSRYSSGWIYSPEFGGRSANPEFELLTGFSTQLLPPNAIAYSQFLTRKVPSLPRYFRDRGYRSSALHVDLLEFFNYPKAYSLLGFSEARTIRKRPGVQLDAARRIPSDEALVDFVIETSRHGPPFFIFAFTNATHLPYDYDVFLDSPLDVVGDVPAAVRREVKTYVNALREADRAIEKLVQHFAASDERVVIAILGDHLPGLSPDAFVRSRMWNAPTPVERTAAILRCPAVLWSNLAAPKVDFELSFNFFAQRILREAGATPDGYWTLNGSIAAQYPVFSRFIQDASGRRFFPHERSADDRARLEPYELVQHDLMFGEGRSWRLAGPAEQATRPSP